MLWANESIPNGVKIVSNTIIHKVFLKIYKILF